MFTSELSNLKLRKEKWTIKKFADQNNNKKKYNSDKRQIHVEKMDIFQQINFFCWFLFSSHSYQIGIKIKKINDCRMGSNFFVKDIKKIADKGILKEQEWKKSFQSSVAKRHLFSIMNGLV